MVDDETLVAIAKAQIGGEDLPATKDDWAVAIQERADTICQFFGFKPPASDGKRL
jgi:hypothetical protein